MSTLNQSLQAPELAADSHRSRDAFERPLNPMDCTMLAVDQALRAQGGAGFETLAMVQLGGRVDSWRLQSALAALCQLHPLLTARLTSDRRRLMWRSAETTCPLHEMSLSTADDQAVLSHAAKRLGTPRELHASDPVSFELVHLPDDRDVFLMRYNHAFIDNISASQLLRHIDSCFQLMSEQEGYSELEELPVRIVQMNPIETYLGRVSRWERLRAAAATARLRLAKLGGTSVQVAGPASASSTTVKLITRQLDAESTARLKRCVLETYRFPSVSMVLLASLFRSIRDVRNVTDNNARFIAGIGLDLGIRRPEPLYLQNLISLVPIDATHADLADREGLVRHLAQQFRQRISDKIDLGVVSLSSIFKRARGFTNWSMKRLMRSGYSCWYGCFDQSAPVTQQFCETDVSEFRYFGPAWTPPGFTLLANTWQGRLLFQASYVPETVPDLVAEILLERFFADLNASIGD